MSDGTTQVVSNHQCPACGKQFNQKNTDYCYVGWLGNSGNDGGFCCSTDCAKDVIERAEQ